MVDHRRQALHMARLRSIDDMAERRKRLGKGLGKPSGDGNDAAGDGGKAPGKGKDKNKKDGE